MARFVPHTGDAAYDERRRQISERGLLTRLANPATGRTPGSSRRLFKAEERYELASWKLLWMLTWRLTVVVWFAASFQQEQLLELAVQAYLFIPLAVLVSRFVLRRSITPWPLTKLIRGKSPFLRLVRNDGMTGVFTKRSWYSAPFSWE